MRKRRLLIARSDDGSAVIESIFGIFFILLLSLGAVQVALALYARNVVLAAVHEGARAAVELGTSETSANVVARRVVQESAGGLVRDLSVRVERRVIGDSYSFDVHATGALVAPGPFPIEIPMNVRTSALREVLDESGR